MALERPPSELGLASLALLGPGASERELEARFAERGASLDPGVAAGLLEELGSLGLARVSGANGSARRWVPTSLGQRLRDADPLSHDADALGELERLRSDLLATISHEFRTPLTALRTGIGLLLDPTLEPSPEQRRSLLETIERNTERMQRLVGDILDLARFRAGGLPLQLRRVDPVEIAEATRASIAPLVRLHAQDIALVVEVEPVPQVYGDRRRLEQALLNLVANAQKFTPDGGRIEVRLSTRDSTVRWSVSDEGPGIPLEDQPRLFERFFVGEQDRPGRGGVGLGLPTALAIAQAHGGTIEVDSAPGRGSRFTLAVPLDGPGEPEP
ncbi:MAG TPA: ATP-binding protein [Candidatus Limnocylindrales bacterium]